MQAQLTLTVLLVALSWFLAEDLDDWSFFRWWTAGWLALFIEIFLGRAILGGGDLDAGRRVAYATVPALGLCQVVFFALGAAELERGRPASVWARIGFLAVAVAVGIGAGLASLGFPPHGSVAVAIQMTPRNLGLAIVYPLCAVAFYRSLRERSGFAGLLVVGGFLLYGIDQGVYAAGGLRDLVSLARGGTGAGGFNALAMLSPAAVRADLAWEGVLGVGAVLLLRSEGRRARKDLLHSEARYRKLFEHSVDGIALVDAAGRVLDANRSLGAMLEAEPSSLLGTSLTSLAAGGGKAWLEELEEEEGTVETTFGRHGTEPFPVELSLSAFQHDGRRVRQVIVRDITARKALEDRLSHRASHHPLTDLPNRRRFEEEFESALARVRRTGSRVGLLFMDLDAFKAVNDTLGHRAGDQVLVEVARRLTQVVRRGDMVGHLGGDEFTVLLHDCLVLDQLREAGHRVLAALEAPIRLGEGEVRLEGSVGGTLSEPADGYESMLRRADQAMYAAKRDGGARLAIAAGSE